METRHSDSDGSDIFWPGYVDATTNLILNLLFLLTILIVAVFMFALELGRTSKNEATQPPVASIEQDAEVVSVATIDSVKENIALKREIERLEKMLAQLASSKKEAEKEASTAATAANDNVEDKIALKLEIERLEKMLAQLASIKQDAEVVSMATIDSVKENIALKREIERLEKMLAQLASSKEGEEVVSKATTEENIALKREIERLEKMLAQLASSKEDEKVVSKATTEENITLKREIERLKMMLAQRGSQEVQSGGLEKSIDATSVVQKPQFGLDKTLASELEIIVRFKDEAVALTPAERKQLLETLKPIVESGKSTIYVEVPAGFSEAKRMGFYRAMAVRNLLIEMKLPKENIDVSVVEGITNANASLVKVRPR